MKFRIRNTSKGSIKFTINEQEEHFFDLFYELLDVGQRPFVHLDRMSNGVLSVYYQTFPVGKVRIKNGTGWIQVLKGVYTVKVYEGDLDVLVSHQESWKRYIKLHCKP